MKIVLDMNLSPAWVDWLSNHDIKAIHWQDIGPVNAPDNVIMEWARKNNCIVYTHDLDFSVILAHTNDSGPSVIQVRGLDLRPQYLGPLFLKALESCRPELLEGALVTITPDRNRVRLLPIHKTDNS